MKLTEASRHRLRIWCGLTPTQAKADRARCCQLAKQIKAGRLTVKAALAALGAL